MNPTTKCTLLLPAFLLAGIGQSLGQGTAFNYQGRLNDGGSPATGSYDLRFTVYDAGAGGTVIAGPLTNSAVSVTSGLFSVTLDFGAAPFTGPGRWLQLEVQPSGGSGFTPLLPRQALLPAPYAIMANTASNLLGTLSAAQLSGAIPASQLSGTPAAAASFTGSLAGDVTGTQAATAVGRIQGVPVAATPPANNQHLRYNGANWVPGAVALGTDVSGSLPLANGGTAAGTAADARANLGAAASGANADITSLSGLTTPLSVARGGSGAATAAGALANLGAPSLTASNNYSGINVLTNLANSFAGNGGGLTNLNASQLIGTNYAATNFSGSLAGDVTGTQGATTVAKVGGQTAASVATATTAANAAASLNTVSTIVKRDSSGNFSAGTITATLTGSASSFSGSLGGDVTGSQGANTVAKVGGVTAANVASGANAANAASSTNGGGNIVKRDSSGNFTSTTITLTGNLNLPTTTATAGAIYIGGIPVLQAVGSGNSFVGPNAGNLTMTGSGNTANGASALLLNSTGTNNTANGIQALFSNTSGNNNTANGAKAMVWNSTGANNTADGAQALYNNTTGSNNIALGYQAGSLIGTGSGNIDIGHPGLPNDANLIRIGSGQTDTYLAGTVHATGNPGFSGVSAAASGNGVWGEIDATNGAGVFAQAYSGSAWGLVARYGTDGKHAAYLGLNNLAADFYGDVHMDSTLTVSGTGTNTFNGQVNAAGGFVIECRNGSDPPNPATGQMWLRTDPNP